jgi:exonuclease III
MFHYIPDNDGNKWRMVVGNINGSPLEGNKLQQSKYDVLKELVRISAPDILCVSEHKRRMNSINRRSRPATTMKNWMVNTISRYTWMRGEPDSKDELGGTGIITSGKASTHTIGSGDDDKNMGRWNWVTIQGKRGTKTTVISIYQPEEHFEVSNRQHAYMCTHYRHISHIPVTQIWEDDLINLINRFKGEGHNVIAAGDWNNDLNNPHSRINRLLGNAGLREVLVQRYGRGPNTHMRGRTTIDGVFATEGINITRGGYTTIDDSPSDHRWIWVDIEEKGIIGTKRDDYAPPLERRATSKIPSVRHAFESLCNEQINQHKLLPKILRVRAYGEEHKSLDIEHYRLYNEVEDRLQRAVKYADQKCRTIKRGHTPFSPKLKRLIGSIKLFRAMLQRVILIGKSHCPRSRYIRRLAKKINYSGSLSMSKDELIKKLHESCIAYNAFKPTAKEHRYRHLQDIADELAAQGNIKSEAHYKQLLQQERLKDKYSNISQAEKKKIRCGVNKVDIDTDDGVQTIMDHTEINREIIKANKAKRLQAGNTPL